MPSIEEFPLIWRWTNATHALFSEAELAGLCPCSTTEAARIRDTRFSDPSDRLDKRLLKGARMQSADSSTTDGCKWLRAQSSNLAECVTVSWDRDTALRTTWKFFTAHWDDFCYPLSDDVLVLPDSERWVLRYHHEEIFYFSYGNA